jgi:hypothetical protein
MYVFIYHKVTNNMRQGRGQGIIGPVVCGLPVIHAPKRPIGIIRKEKGISGPRLQAVFGITGPQWHPTTVTSIMLNARMHRKKKKNTKPSYERTFEHKTNILRP